MAQIKDILSLKKDVVFGGAVQTDWYYDKEKSKTISENFIFHGPTFFGVTEDDIEYKSHKLMDTCSYAELIANKLYEEDGNPIALTIAGYGTGKSHLAVTLGQLFSSNQDDLVYNKIIKNIYSADTKIAENIKLKTTKPNLVIVLNGMKDFNLNYEILNTAKKVLKSYGYGEEIFSEYTKAYNIAQLFLERNFDNFENEFKEAANKSGITSLNLKNYLLDNIYKDEVFDCINEVYNYVTGNYIRWDEGISSADVLSKLVDKMCGDNAPFNKLLILFDEFGRYIEYASDYPNRAGDSALQQIFEVIQDSNNNIIFVGFIQSDLKTYLSRVNKTSNISRYIGRYEAGEKIYLSSNLETIFANLIKIKDKHLYDKYIDNNLNKDKVIEENNLLFNKIGDWLPVSKNRGVWNNKEKFESVILKGIYPFHPLSTWMLNYLSDWYQQRSAINFLIGSFDIIENKEITELGALPNVMPIDIVKGEFFKELLLAENEGRQKSENCTLYDKIYIKYHEKLSRNDLDVLAGILILKLGKFRTSSKDDVLTALKYITGIKVELIQESLKELEESYGVIEYDEKNNTYDFIEDATGINDFKRFIKKKKLSYENQDVEILLNNDIKEKLGLNINFQTDFGQKNNIKTNEWQYEQDIVTCKRIDSVYVENLKKDIDKSTSPDKPKGKLIYVYNNSSYGLDIINKLSDLYKDYNLNNYPILWVLLDDVDNYLYDILIDMSIIPKFTEDEKMKFSKFITTFVNKTDEGLKSEFEKMRKERMVINESGIEKSQKRLKQLCGDKLGELYPKVITFPFDGFDKKSISNAKKIHGTIAKSILSNQLNYQWIQIQNKEVQNRLSMVLQNKLIGWGVLDNEYQITVPQNIKLKNLFDEIDVILSENEEIKLYDLYSKYVKVPYGLNDYSFSLLIAIYIMLKSIEIKIFQNGKAIKTIDWAANFYKEKALDFTYLKQSKIQKVNLDQYLLRYQIICEKIEKNIDISMCTTYRKQLEDLLAEEEPPQAFEVRVEACKRMVLQGEQVYNKSEKDIARLRGSLEKGIEEIDFKYVTPIIIECEGKSSIIEEGLPYRYNDKQLETFNRLAEQGRKFIEKSYESFLPTAKCHSVGQMTKYEGWMHNLRKDLEKLGYLDFARKTKTKLENELESLKLISKRQSMEEDIKKFLVNIKPGEYTSQEQLLAWEKEGKEFISMIGSNKYIDDRDKESFIVAINSKLKDNTKYLDKIKNSIMDIIDKSLELNSVKEANNLLIDIKTLLEKKLRENDRLDIQETGEIIQNLLNDLKDIDILDSLKDRIKEAEILKAKYQEYEEDQILSTISIIQGYINDLNEKIENLNIKWISKNLSFEKSIIDTWNSDECFSWIRSTRGLPEYLTDKTIQAYEEIKSLVELQINRLNIESIVNIFKDLSNDKKKECINILSKMI